MVRSLARPPGPDCMAAPGRSWETLRGRPEMVSPGRTFRSRPGAGSEPLAPSLCGKSLLRLDVRSGPSHAPIQSPRGPPPLSGEQTSLSSLRFPREGRSTLGGPPTLLTVVPMTTLHTTQSVRETSLGFSLSLIPLLLNVSLCPPLHFITTPSGFHLDNYNLFLTGCPPTSPTSVHSPHSCLSHLVTGSS